MAPAPTLQDAPKRRGLIRHFELAPSTGQNLDALDGLRGVAVVAIFLRHAWGLSGSPRPLFTLGGHQFDLSPLIAMMSNGVDLFFVLSGFLLARRFIAANLDGRPRPLLGPYFRTRALRILPAYFAAVAFLVLVFVPVLLPESLYWSRTGALTIVSHLTTQQTLFPWSYGVWGIASPYWTLSLEVLFYALLPWVIPGFYGKRAARSLVLCGVITFGWLVLTRSIPDGVSVEIGQHSLRDGAGGEFVRFWLSKQLPGWALSFGVGMFVANLYERTLRNQVRFTWMTVRMGRLILAAGCAWILLSMYALGYLTQRYRYYDGIALLSDHSGRSWFFWMLESPSMAIGFGLCLIGVLALSAHRRVPILAATPLRLVGILGYAIYLWHMPMLYLYNRIPSIAELSPWPHWIALSVVTGIAVVLISIGSFFFVEKPMIVRGRATGRPAGPRPPVTASPTDAGPAVTDARLETRQPAPVGATQPDRYTDL